MDRATDCDLYEMINGYRPTNDAPFPSITTAPTITTTTTTTLNSAISNNNQMLGDWRLDAMVPIDASMPSFTTTPSITTFTPTTTYMHTAPLIPSNNNQMWNDWGLDVMVNRYPPTIEASIPSFTTTTFTPTTTLANNNQMLGDWGLDVGTHMGLPNDSLSSSAIATPISTTFIPTITNPQVMHNQTQHHWEMANSSSSVFAATTPTTPAVNNQNWDGSYHWGQHTTVNSFSSSIGGSSSLFLGPRVTTPSMPTPTNVDYLQNSSFQEVHQRQPLVNTYTYDIKQLMQNSNHPLNVPKTPLANNNWPILTLPGYGKLTETPTHKQQQQQQLQVQRRQEILKYTKTNAQSPSESSERKREKRIYKMPLEAVKNDVWSWRKYGEKSIDGSPYPRVYYKCNSSKECEAKRRVEQKRSDPDFVILKYSGYHNHPLPSLMNSSISSAITNPTDTGIDTNDDNNSNSSKVVSPTTTMNLKNKHIVYEGLENFVDLEKST